MKDFSLGVEDTSTGIRILVIGVALLVVPIFVKGSVSVSHSNAITRTTTIEMAGGETKTIATSDSKSAKNKKSI
jgi:hypothetical protein